MTNRKEETFVVGSLVLIIAVELLVHWLLSSGLCPTARLFYLSDDKRNSITMLIDIFIPSGILGFVSGYAGYRWTTRKLNAAAIILASAITCSEVLYSFFFPHVLLWWWPPKLGEALFWFVTAAVFLLFFAHLGRNIQVGRQGRAL